MIIYKKATLNDIEGIQELVRDEVANGNILPRGDDEVATNIRSYTLAAKGEEIVGLSALHIHSPYLAEIRSIVVKRGLRGKGIGASIVKKLLEEGRLLGLKQVFTLTYKKEFFEKLSFKEIPKESLPVSKIWADCIKCKHFPICDETALITDI
ncbi:MAG: N-acetyltransferase [Campylobacteraceae bacterium]|jgi:amino-acid N-acetyltransferase|nr:N-acetyltransferase [Campylobacteraceae bacterium]